MDNPSADFDKADALPVKTSKEDAADEKKTFDFWKDTTVVEKIKFFFGNITVEPILACYIVPSVLAQLATQNLYLEKACTVNLNYSEEVCSALSRRDTANYSSQEAEVQQLVAKMNIWKSVLQNSIPMILVLFLGSWTDRHGRKFCMLLPIVGELLTSLGQILCVYFWGWSMEIAGLFEAIFPAITGGWMTMGMAVFSYIADVTTVEMRTLRVGFVNVFISLGIPIGTALSGILYVKIGFYGVFTVSTVLYLLSMLYVIFRIDNIKPKITPEQKKIGFWKDLLDLNHVVNTFRVTFKKRKSRTTLRIILLMVVCFVSLGPLFGELAVAYLFTRYRFNWNEVQYSMFSTYKMVTSLVGTIVSVGILSYVYKMDDAIIGAMSCISGISASFVYAFSNVEWMFYIAPLVDIMNGTSLIALRSIVSKIVPNDELGKVNSVFGVIDAVVPLVYSPMYSALYASTMNIIPGAFYLLGGAFTVPALCIFIWLYKLHKRDRREKQGESTTFESKGKKGHPSEAAFEDSKSVKIISFMRAYDNEGFAAEA